MRMTIMKRITVLLLACIILCSLASALAEQTENPPRILIAYLSRAGENYNVGEARPGSASASYAGYIEKGNTAMLAAVIADLTGGDLFEIRTVIPYPDDYATMLQVAQDEIDTDARPELEGIVENMADYDVIFIGYPIWHGRIPQAIHTFLESYDLTGKTVIPFNTHEGSGQSGTQQVITDALPGCTVLQGLAVRGKTAQEDPEETRELVAPWLEEMNMKKAGNEEAQVLVAYETIQQAMIDKDIETLDSMCMEGTTFTHMSGKTQTKEEFFGEIADGILNYYAYLIHDPQITVEGNEAELTASVTLTAKVYGASGDWTLPVHACFTKTDGKWIAHN